VKELQPMKIRGRGSLTVMEIGLSVVVDRGRGLQQQIMTVLVMMVTCNSKIGQKGI